MDWEEFKACCADIWHLILVYIVAVYDHFRYLTAPKLGKSLVNEVAVVTGAGHGIGRELSLQLARAGAKVVCWDIDEMTAENTAQEIRRRHGIAYSFRCDVGNRQEVKEVAQKTR